MLIKPNSWILTFSFAATVGCGASTSENPGETADAGVDVSVTNPASCEADANASGGLLVPVDFSRMTWRENWELLDYNGPCPKQGNITIVLDALASTLTWTGLPSWSTDSKVCQRQGQLTLTRPQIEALWQSSPTELVSGPAGCLDTSLITLDVDRCGETTRYVDSRQGCQASPDLLVAEGLGNFYAQVQNLLPQKAGTTPVFVAPDGFVRFAVHLSGGMPWGARDAGMACNSSYENIYTVDAATRIFTWDYCKWNGSSVTAPATGSRTLNDDELARLTRALSILKLHDASDCGYDKPTITLDLETRSGSATYTDSFYACQAKPGAVYVDNIDDLTNAISTLLK
jgi:hypothetical protein